MHDSHDPPVEESKQPTLIRKYNDARNPARREKQRRLNELALARRPVRRRPEIIKREEWEADPPRGPVGTLVEPVDTLFLHTSVTVQLPPTATLAQEKAAVRALQDIAFARKFFDTSYSWGFAPSGRIYELRGDSKVQAATEGFNSTSYSFVTIGNTDTNKPTKKQLESMKDMADFLQRNGSMTDHVDIRGHREVAPKACPGAKFTDELISEMQRFVNHH